MTVSLPAPKRDSLISCIKQMLSRRQTSTFEMMSLLGRLEAIKPAFSMTPLYCRRLQRWSIAHLTNRSPSHEPLPLETDQLEELQFWATILPSLQPQPIITYQGSAVRFQTDASLTGWGVKVDDQVDYGRWTSEESKLHINTLELLGIYKGLQTFASSLTNRNVIICGDNITSLAYINKMGGTRSARMSEMAIDIWRLAQRFHINLEIEHVPGELNREADHLSRLYQEGLNETTEWRLNKSQFNLLVRRWGPFERDLFASHWNHQLPNYITWKDQHHTMNAFHHQWINGDYLFPPFSLIGRVLRKIRQDKCKVVLVAPKWETQPWYPTLREMLHSKPIKLWGNFRDRAGNPHPLGQALHLTAYLRTRLVQEGVSEETSHVAVNAWAPETIRKYQSSWKKWPAFSETKGKNPCANPIDINHVADFLASQSKAGITYSQIRCYISALSAILPKLHGKNLSQHDLITKVMRSARRANPPKARYNSTWNVETVDLEHGMYPIHP